MNKEHFAYFMEEYLQEVVNWKSMVSPGERVSNAIQKTMEKDSQPSKKAANKLFKMGIRAEDLMLKRAEKTGKMISKPEDFSNY